MADSPNNLIQDCPKCATLIDVAGQEPFALMHCPKCGARMRVRRKFDHFELEEQLGAGGMGTVFRALDQNLGRQVALKLLQKEQSTNPEYIAQFAKEAAITASINHPHVVKVYSSGVDHGLVYIAMELMHSGSLDDLLARHERVPEEQALTTGIQIAQGLNAAFRRGLIHRDVKPGNILFADPQTAKIVDFGLAVLMEHAGTVVGEVWGTPAYVAPEKLDDKPEDLRSDLYSLGATLFHALAGRPSCTLETNQMSALLAAKREEPGLRAVVPDVTAATAFAIDKMLKFDPAERFQTYEEAIEALEFARNEATAAAQAAEAGEQPAEPTRAPKKKPHWLIGVAVAVLALGGVAVYKAREDRRPKPPPEEEAVRGGGIDERYQAARMLLAGSEGPKAAKAFRELEALPNVPQPRLNWITLHAGLAEFLAGNAQEGRADFVKLQERGIFSPDPTEQRLANFFVDTAKLAATDQPVAAETVKSMDLEGEELVALLIFATKDWALEDYENAGAIFRRFGEIELPAKAAWVADYKVLAEPLAADCALYLACRDAAKNAGTPEQREAALLRVTSAAGGVRPLPPGITRRLGDLGKDLKLKIAADQVALAARLKGLEAADEKALDELKTKLLPLCQQYRFAEAHALAKALSVRGEKNQKLAASMVQKIEWLARFKATLIADITAIGYTAPLVKKNTGQIPGGAHLANDTQIEAVSQFGNLKVPWTELSDDCVFAIGQSFLHAALPPEKLADRQWLLGVFARFLNKKAQGRELLLQACQGKAEYRGHIGILIDAAEAP